MYIERTVDGVYLFLVHRQCSVHSLFSLSLPLILNILAASTIHDKQHQFQHQHQQHMHSEWRMPRQHVLHTRDTFSTLMSVYNVNSYPMPCLINTHHLHSGLQRFSSNIRRSFSLSLDFSLLIFRISFPCILFSPQKPFSMN